MVQQQEVKEKDKKDNGTGPQQGAPVEDKILNVEMVCRGITPLLMHRMPDETLWTLFDKNNKKSATENIGQTITPRDVAKMHVYERDGKAYIPHKFLFASLMHAGTFIRLDGKRQMSSAKSTTLPNFLTIMDAEMPLILPDDPLSPAPWEPDMQKGTNPNGGQAVCVIRPRFDRWAFMARLVIDTTEIGENAIRKLVDKAGKLAGLGAYRPQRKGPYGQYVVDRWTRVRFDD